MKIHWNHGRTISLVSTFFLCAAVLFLFSPPAHEVHAQDRASGEEQKEEGQKEQDLSVGHLIEEFQNLENALSPLELDTNGDGRIDYMVKTHVKTNEKMMEVLDFNNDGKMDDFYFYERGVLQKRAVDSNYDGLIDLRVYIKDGVYIAYYEKDSDFDGTMETLKRYAAEESEDEKEENDN